MKTKISPDTNTEIQLLIDKMKLQFAKQSLKHEDKKDLQIYLSFKEILEIEANFQIYLASDYSLKFANTPGSAAQKGYWDFNHKCFNDLKDFLKTGFSLK